MFLWYTSYRYCSLNLLLFPVKKVIRQELQAHAHELWGLLPAFCRHPTDVSMSFQSFAELLLVRLKKDSSMYEDIADALQVLAFSKCFFVVYCEWSHL